ncbi:hypothetical protein Val02_35110 [Virgisporangium aliadipatigenens]|uniref:Uncharacterized protein n=1 Tax=Virgisporangium aliadipatigenens TaxID=741659 RepID=A0A8J3YMF9_9ACTN|nr:hypothetical protein [Virgisporangium aliadipatigenens]GIJ46625.1 hypothetical protein Val02_35110 [Virgisporangium aliadipatigenens]
MTPDAEHVTYDTATPEQLAAARDRARTRLAEAERRRTPQRRARLLETLGLPADAA